MSSRQISIVQPPESGDVYTPAAVDSLVGQQLLVTQLVTGDNVKMSTLAFGTVVAAELKSDGVHMTIALDE